jgi:hypothetical protein
LLIAVVIPLVSVFTYFSSTTKNPLTGETQRVAMTPEQDVARGLKSAPEMAAQMGGLSRNREALALVQQTGRQSQTAVEIGADAILRKPFSLESLEAVLSPRPT